MAGAWGAWADAPAASMEGLCFKKYRDQAKIHQGKIIYIKYHLCVGWWGLPRPWGCPGAAGCGAGRGCAVLLAVVIFPKISRKLPRVIFKPCSCEPFLFNHGFCCHFLPVGLLSSCLNSVSRPLSSGLRHT